MSQSIGDNSLIKSILATRISETPTRKVEEVEIPKPAREFAEAEVIETLSPTPEPPKVDYAEYDEEPARIQKEIPFTENDQAQILPNAAPERKEKQRQISARWGVRLYDKLQALGSMFAYERLNEPKTLIQKRDVLLEKVYDGSIDEDERIELKKINQQVDTFIDRRTGYHETVYMSQELIDDIADLVEEVMVVSNKHINPMWILVMLLLLQPTINLITAFSHRMQYNTRF